MMMTCIYFNYLMKHLAKANRCWGRYNIVAAEGSHRKQNVAHQTEERLVSAPPRHELLWAISAYRMGVERHNVLFVEERWFMAVSRA